MRRFSLYRIYRIVWMAVSFFLQIYRFERKHKDWGLQTSEQWEDLLQKQAITYKKTATELGGLLIKIGQFLSTRADLLPRVFIDELEGLVDHVPALPWEDAKATLEEEWGVSYDHYVKDMGREPEASASIGVVYKGYLHSGEPVAIKIRRRHIEKIMNIDFKALRIVVWIMSHFTSFGKKFHLERMYRELVKVTTNELDFVREMENGLYFQREFAEDDAIYIPQFYKTYSTGKVLVMEWIEGYKVTDQAYLYEYNIDRKQVAENVFRCFANQFLYSGKFHADPHSGNVFVEKDGTVVLLDFGMVSTIDPDTIVYFRQLVEGILFEDYSKVFSALESLGFLLPSADKRELEHAIKAVIDLYTKENLSEINNEKMEEILGEVMKIIQEQPIQLPSEFAFLGRSMSVLVGLLVSTYPSIDFLEIAKPIVNQWIKSDEHDKTIPTSTFQYAKEWAKPFLQYPVLIKQFLESPDRRIQWENQKLRKSYIHDVYSTRKSYAVFSFFIGLIAVFISVFFEQWFLVIGGSGFTVISAIFYLLISFRHRRWIKSFK